MILNILFNLRNLRFIMQKLQRSMRSIINVRQRSMKNRSVKARCMETRLMKIAEFIEITHIILLVHCVPREAFH